MNLSPSPFKHAHHTNRAVAAIEDMKQMKTQRTKK